MSFGSLTDGPATLLLTGVRVVDAGQGSDGIRDLAILDGRVADPAELPADAVKIEGRGLTVVPGLCDLHAHLREPGAEASETIESGARAAAHGGYTTVCAMPNTDPPLDEPQRVAWVTAMGGDAACRVRVIGAVTRGGAGEQLTDLGALASEGVVAFSDDGSAVSSAGQARAALGYLAGLGLPLIEHAEEPSLARGALMRGGRMATRLGLPGWPVSAEATMVERDIALATETGGRLHLTHLSTAAGLAAVRRAKERALPVSCDVTPHHLALTDAWVGGSRGFAWDEAEEAAEDRDVLADYDLLDPALAYDGSCRVNPPLPAREDALALLAGVADGSVDAIATDHAPHPPERTVVPFAEAAPGMIGLETALSLGLAAVQAGAMTLPALVAALSSRPAALIGEARSLAIGAVADLVAFDAAARWRVEPGALASRSANTPLLGRELPGVVQLTMAEGRVTYDAGLLGRRS